MRSRQSTANISGGALPVCLSGIGIHPSVQPSIRSHYHYHQRNETMRPMPSLREYSIVELDVISTTEATPEQRLDERSLNEVLLRHDILQERPHHNLALQMADLDRQRETIKKHGSNRVLVHFVDEQSTFLQWHNHHMKSVICSMMHNPSFQSEFVTALEHNSCAKAA